MGEKNKKISCENLKPQSLTKHEKESEFWRKKNFKTLFKDQNEYLEVKSTVILKIAVNNMRILKTTEEN